MSSCDNFAGDLGTQNCRNQQQYEGDHHEAQVRPLLFLALLLQERAHAELSLSLPQAYREADRRENVRQPNHTKSC